MAKIFRHFCHLSCFCSEKLSQSVFMQEACRYICIAFRSDVVRLKANQSVCTRGFSFVHSDEKGGSLRLSL